MTKKPTTSKDAADKVLKNIQRKTRQTYSAEEKIRIVLAGLRGEESIAVLCRREGIAESLYYSWSKEFLEAGACLVASTFIYRSPSLFGPLNNFYTEILGVFNQAAISFDAFICGPY